MDLDALRIDARDNVVTVLRPVSKGCLVRWSKDGDAVAARSDVPAGHKIAIVSIGKAAAIRKYGQPIGTAAVSIAPGEWVHVHNVRAVEE